MIDGTLIPIDRIAADRPFCSGNAMSATIVDVSPFSTNGLLVLADACGVVLLGSF